MAPPELLSGPVEPSNGYYDIIESIPNPHSPTTTHVSKITHMHPAGRDSVTADCTSATSSA